MRVSLIYVQTAEANNVIPPMGLMYVASVARDAGHDVQLLDVDPDEIDVPGKVGSFKPDLVGLSFLTTEFEKARNLSHELKKALPDVTLCSGGVHTTVDPETVLRRFAVDFCVVGEGEITFREVCKRMEEGQSYEDTKGICFLKDGHLVKNEPRELIKDLDSMPFFARDLVDFSNIYLTFPGVIRGKYIRSTVVMAGRGCYFNCSFCCVEKMCGRQYRLRSPDNILREITHLQETYGVKGIYFVDSTLTANKRWIMSLCEEIIRRNMKFVWAGNTRVDTVNMEMLRLMKRAGCVQVDYGVESGSPKILEILNKRILPEKAVSSVRMTRDAGIRVGATFMIGNPDEEPEDLEMTFDLAKKINADYTIFFFTVPYPGTRLWKISRKRNLIQENIPYDNRWIMRQSEFPMLADRLSKTQLRTYRARFQNYFFRKNYIRLSNMFMGLQLFWVMLTNMPVVWKGIKIVFRSKRWDSLVEGILVAYRKSLYKFYY